jgi:transposase InsO family protein
MELTLKERQKLTRITARKYRQANKRGKTKILDTFTAQSGYGRKYAIHVLANEGKLKPAPTRVKLKATHRAGPKRAYPRVYDEAVREALIPIWEAFNRQCGKLLAPFLRANIDRIAAEPKFPVPARTLEKLRRISAASIDRLLRPLKAALRLKGTSGTRPAPNHLKALIPVLSHFQCKEQGAGLWQIDLVQHDGGNPSGDFCFTLTITGISSCWTVHYALRNKAFRWVFQALQDACSRLPLPVRILHSDNGSEFINHALATWCAQQGIALSRSRGDKKNDNCFVEQKNGNTVRKIVGYARFAGDRGVAALQEVYCHYDRLLNFFYPCQKLISKEREGQKVKKKYDTPRTPCERVISDPAVPQQLRDRMQALKADIDLMGEMKLMQQALDKLPSLADPVPVFVSNRVLKPLRIRPHGSNS